MRLNVMLNSIGLSGLVAAWSKGKKWVSLGDGDVEFDVAALRISPGVNGGPAAAVLVHAAEAYVGRYRIAGPYDHEVQSFRVKTPSGGGRYVLYCAECGASRTIGADELQDVGLDPCAACQALAVGKACPRHHNWGTCPECEPTLSSCSSGDLLVNERVGRPPLGEDPEPTKAGPSASSLGSAGSEVARLDVTG